MKNKRSTYYLLIPVTMVIWSLVIFKIVKSVKPPTVETKNYFTEDIIDPSIQNEDTVKLVASYRDPFLGDYTPVKTTKTTKIKEPENKAFRARRVEQKQVSWPEISYGGMIGNQSKNQNTALVNIAGADRLVHPGEKIQGIVFTEISRDSIRVEYQSQKKTYLKK